MDRQLMEIILPRLARRLYKQLEQFRLGEMNHAQFSKHFESLLQKQSAWLSSQGIPEEDAAIAINAGVLVLSGPGLRAEAQEQKIPLEVVEFRAAKTAAHDLAKEFKLPKNKVLKKITTIMAHYAE